MYIPPTPQISAEEIASLPPSNHYTFVLSTADKHTCIHNWKGKNICLGILMIISAADFTFVINLHMCLFKK